MIYLEKQIDLFKLDSKYYLAHCISADYALGAGIAVQFQNKFGLKSKLKQKGLGIFPDCIQVGRVFNLVTKANYYDKPTYKTIEDSLILLKESIDMRRDIKYLAIPKIGCGLDKLTWRIVSAIIQDVFGYTDIEIIVCSL